MKFEKDYMGYANVIQNLSPSITIVEAYSNDATGYGDIIFNFKDISHNLTITINNSLNEESDVALILYDEKQCLKSEVLKKLSMPNFNNVLSDWLKKILDLNEEAIKFDPDKTYTAAEVVILLATYAGSDLGNNSVEQVKKERPGFVKSMTERATSWLEFEQNPGYYLRDISQQKYLCSNGTWSTNHQFIAKFKTLESVEKSISSFQPDYRSFLHIDKKLQF